MFCDISYPDGFYSLSGIPEASLKQAVAQADARASGLRSAPRWSSHLFRVDEQGNDTKIPYDRARLIWTLRQMTRGIDPPGDLPDAGADGDPA